MDHKEVLNMWRMGCFIEWAGVIIGVVGIIITFGSFCMTIYSVVDCPEKIHLWAALSIVGLIVWLVGKQLFNHGVDTKHSIINKEG